MEGRNEENILNLQPPDRNTAAAPTDPVIQSLRLGTADDADAIAALHAESWRSAYRGLLPDEDLGEKLDDERRQFWRKRFAAPDPERRIVFLATANDVLVGFACVLADADPAHGPLLDNLHVKPGWRGHGIGTRLLHESRAWSRAIAPGQPMHLWVLEGNAPARRFYRNQGGVEEERLSEERGGMTIAAWRCIWRD
jgi:GNAT superfamily N-acetyltransferase